MDRHEMKGLARVIADEVVERLAPRLKILTKLEEAILKGEDDLKASVANISTAVDTLATEATVIAAKLANADDDTDIEAIAAQAQTLADKLNGVNTQLGNIVTPSATGTTTPAAGS